MGPQKEYKPQSLSRPPQWGKCRPPGFSRGGCRCKIRKARGQTALQDKLSVAFNLGASGNGRKRFTVLLAALAPGLIFAFTASAEQPAAPQSAVESVIVTAPALRSEKALDN